MKNLNKELVANAVLSNDYVVVDDGLKEIKKAIQYEGADVAALEVVEVLLTLKLERLDSETWDQEVNSFLERYERNHNVSV